jgi:excisionase family DNA binding protein
MTLEQQIQEIVVRSVREAVRAEVPEELKRLTAPADPDRLYSYAQAAEYLGVTESCVRERVKAGDLEVIQLGKYSKIPHSSIHQLICRELDRQRFERDQVANVLPADVDDEIAELLQPKATSRKGRVGKREGQRKR